ncbi:hypothetical protein [Longispora albida]|uniref:hypothetical protein n=1 Tax=Longispora albida TaxID=203523 RepID=UPI00039C471B|nr:hypothetical protein [Longispora albida]
MTHPAMRVARFGVVGAMVAGMLAFGASPALAADTLKVNVDPGTVSIEAGQTKAVRITVENTSDKPAPSVKLAVQLPSNAQFSDGAQSSPGFTCSLADQGKTATCQIAVLPKDGKAVVQFMVGSPQGTPSTNLPATVNASAAGFTVTGEQGFNVDVKGAAPPASPTAAPGVPSVSGMVQTLTTAEPVSGATVKVTDSAGQTNQVATGEDGKFTVPARDPNGFKAGTLTILITKAGTPPKTTIKSNVPGGVPLAGLNLAIDVKASATPSAPASSAPAATSAAPQPQDSAVAGNSGTKTGTGDGGLGALTWILIGLGILLVGGGGLAIFFLLRKGKEEDDEPVAPKPTVYGGAGGARPMPPADDAPTMMHQGPLVTDDPYGYQPGGYGRTDQYGAPADPYGAPPQQAAPTQQFRPGADAYGQAGQGEATRQYQPPVDPYADQTRQFGGPQTAQYPPQGGQQPQQYGGHGQQQPRQQERRPLDWLDD